MPEAPGIDTRFLVALYALAVESFANGRAAALPRPPVGFPLEGLAFLPADAVEDKRAAVQFSLIANARISPPIGTLGVGTLWDRYAETLDHGSVMLAERQPTVEETARHDAAVQLLTPEAMATYTQCLSALGVAKLNRNALGPEPPEGDPGQVAWQAARVAADTEVIRATNDLLVRGRQADVEAALAVVSQWSTAANLVTWAKYSTELDEALDQHPDDLTEYALTSFVPGNVALGEGWTRFDLPRERIDGLIAGLDPQLQAVAGPSTSTPVRNMAVELASVSINRPWFEPSIFESHAWRFADATREAISDGGEPASGSFPYVVTGLVLARSVSLELDPPPPDGAPITLMLDLKQVAFLETPATIRRARVVEVAAAAAEPARIPVMLRSRRTLTLPAADVALATPAAEPATGTPLRVRLATSMRRVGLGRIGPVVLGRAAEPAPEPAPAPAVDQPVTATAIRTFSPAALDKMRALDFAVPAPVTAPPPPPPPPVTNQELVPADQAIVVAYLLTKFSKAPDPDPSLTWPGS